jgi:hypothetical protein
MEQSIYFYGKGRCVLIRTNSRHSVLGLGLLVTALTALMGSGSRADLFVSSQSYNLVGQYDENTGDFLDNFVPAQGGVISAATYLTFTKTDPTTLQYKP